MPRTPKHISFVLLVFYIFMLLLNVYLGLAFLWGAHFIMPESLEMNYLQMESTLYSASYNTILHYI